MFDAKYNTGGGVGLRPRTAAREFASLRSLKSFLCILTLRAVLEASPGPEIGGQVYPANSQILPKQMNSQWPNHGASH